MTNVIVIHNLANGKQTSKKVAFQMIAAFSVFDLPHNLSISSHQKTIPVNGDSRSQSSTFKVPVSELMVL